MAGSDTRMMSIQVADNAVPRDHGFVSEPGGDGRLISITKRPEKSLSSRDNILRIMLQPLSASLRQYAFLDVIVISHHPREAEVYCIDRRIKLWFVFHKTRLFLLSPLFSDMFPRSVVLDHPDVRIRDPKFGRDLRKWATIGTNLSHQIIVKLGHRILFATRVCSVFDLIQHVLLLSPGI